MAKKSAFQRPYKSRSERREIDRRKHDEAKDYKFLIRVAIAIGLVLVVALGFAITGVVDNSGNLAQSTMSR
ncbi:hypothetical protein SAMN04515668_1808 [Hymenobacter arizonensis]|uniref:Uncharacterized protein n=2 Tax=Hymenobacter arizonensis TaxID=1227077 RepID=A0A1I5XFG5_HYMAR|nr:hypothetical protein SAMN04515668_1808 [Hymenobacter arizonensis]